MTQIRVFAKHANDKNNLVHLDK